MPDETLKNLIEHFSKHNLSLENVPEDELGNGYEYLIKQFADDSGNTAQEFYTNRTLVHLMAQMLQPQPEEDIYDPTCGTGGMLISCMAEVKRQGGDPRSMGLYGQELINITSAIARMNLVLGYDFEIKSGNTLSNPAFVEGMNSKPSMSSWQIRPTPSRSGTAKVADDQWGRNFLGTSARPCRLCLLPAYPQKHGSKDRAVRNPFPHGVLFRNEEAEMRTKLIEKDLWSVYWASRAASSLANEGLRRVLPDIKAEGARGKSFFIDAVDEVAKERSQSFLRRRHQKNL